MTILRRVLPLLLGLACLSACAILVIQNAFLFGADSLTKAHGEEMTAALNYFWEVIYQENYRLHYIPLGRSTVPTDSQAENACAEIAVDSGMHFCLDQIAGYHMGNSTQVVTRIRVLEYQSDCAIVAAIFQSAWQTDGAFILRRVDGIWKVAFDWVKAGDYNGHNMFSESNPPLPFSCEHAISD